MPNDSQQSRRNRRQSGESSSKRKAHSFSWWTWIKRGLLFLFILVIIALTAGAGLFLYYAKDTPELTMEDLQGSYASELVDRNGEVFYTLGADEREFATADEYPQILLDAVTSIEDQRFYEHPGIDPIGIARAALGILTNRGQIVGGGSTITQQLIKLSVFSTLKQDQNLKRKAQEAVLALQLEKELSKEQIMTLYLNKVHMGGNIYGMATAAEKYYGKHVSELELHEAALFAGMPKAPNYYNPLTEPENAKKRRDLVLDVMVETKKITKEQAEQAKSIPIEQGLIEPKGDEDTLVYDGYITAILKEVQEKTDYDPYKAGLRIETNLDSRIQNILYRVANTNDYIPYRDDEMQAAYTVVEPETGKILGMVGGRKQTGQLSTNRALDMKRNVASTMKPLSTYGPAIEFEKYSTYHQVVDEPFSIGNYTPKNYDNSFRGALTLRQALVDSRNIPALKIFNQDLDHGDVTNFLAGLGIDASKLNAGSEGLVPSNAINGTMTPLQLVGAYAAFANGGHYTKPYTVSKIITQTGEEIDLSNETKKAMEDYTAYMITDILKDIVYNYYSMPVANVVHAGKTGTTNYSDEEIAQYNIPSGAVPDSWYVGYSKAYAISAWVGYDKQFEPGHYLTFDDGSINFARLANWQIMQLISEGQSSPDWERPSSVVELPIVAGTNPPKLAPAGMSGSKVVRELFVRGAEPKETAKPEEEMPAPSGLTAQYSAESQKVSVSWQAHQSEDDKPVEYVISVNGKAQTVSSTSIEISNPTSGTMTISVAIKVGGKTGPESTVTFEVPAAPSTEPQNPPGNNNDSQSGGQNSGQNDPGAGEPPKEPENEDS